MVSDLAYVVLGLEGDASTHGLSRDEKGSIIFDRGTKGAVIRRFLLELFSIPSDIVSFHCEEDLTDILFTVERDIMKRIQRPIAPSLDNPYKELYRGFFFEPRGYFRFYAPSLDLSTAYKVLRDAGHTDVPRTGMITCENGAYVKISEIKRNIFSKPIRFFLRSKETRLLGIDDQYEFYCDYSGAMENVVAFERRMRTNFSLAKDYTFKFRENMK